MVNKYDWQQKTELRYEQLLHFEQINVFLNHQLKSFRQDFPKEEFECLKGALYETILNAVEHGNFGIGDLTKERLLKDKEYSNQLIKKIYENRHRTAVEIFFFNGEKIFVFLVKGEKTPPYSSEMQERRETTENSLTGRGLNIVRCFFDEVELDFKQNLVLLKRDKATRKV